MGLFNKGTVGCSWTGIGTKRRERFCVLKHAPFSSAENPTLVRWITLSN